MQNVVFLRAEDDHQPRPEFLLEVHAAPACHELLLGIGQLRTSMSETMTTNLVADMANELSRINQAFAEYLAARIKTRGSL